MKALRSLLIASLLALAYNASAQESPYKFEFHGFVVGSLYMQDQVFANGSGQGLLYTAPTPANAVPCKTLACTTGPIPAGTADKSGTFLAGDMRQSRFAFSLAGPKAYMDATPRAYFEGDLFGAGGTEGNWNMRIRQAWAELKWSQFMLQAGQFSAQLAFAQMPDSLAHIAQPISFGAGNYGARNIGVRGYYNTKLNDVALEVVGAVVQGYWTDNTIIGANPNTVSSAQASGTPQLELRVKASGKAGDFGWMVYGDAMYESVDLKRFGDLNPNGVTLADGSTKTSVSPSAFELGGKFSFAPVYVAFNAYTGNGLASMAGALQQAGDVKETAFWVNAGVNLTKEFSLSGTYGYAKPEEKDVRKWATANPTANVNGKGENTLIQAQAKYLENGVATALEYIQYETKNFSGSWAQYTGTAATPVPASITTKGYQIIASLGYFF